MISLSNIHAISVASYFECNIEYGIEYKQSETLLVADRILLGDDNKMGMVNKVTVKPIAEALAKEFYRDRNKEFSELWMSEDAVRLKQVRDYMGFPVFEGLDGELCGWLIFYDPSTFVNWDHDCEYCFIINENNYEKKIHRRPPDSSIEMKQIE